MTVKTKKQTIRTAQTAKKKVTISGSEVFTVRNAKGEVTYEKVSGSGKFTVDQETGDITIKKGTTKGVYKLIVRVTAAGNDNYAAGSGTVPVMITIR